MKKHIFFSICWPSLLLVNTIVQCSSLFIVHYAKLKFAFFIYLVHLLTVCQQTYLQIRSEIICTYALCGFANFSSLGIVIGGLCEYPNSIRRDGICSKHLYAKDLSASYA